MNFPPTIDEDIGGSISRAGVFGRSDDPAKYLIARRRFERPTLSIPDGLMFEWPLGTEGLRVTGNATLVEHLYVGDNATVLQITHLDNRRIEMSGMFPGLTGSENMRELLAVIVAESPDVGKVLSLPGIFIQNQLVVADTYDFDHPQDDRNDSWNYTVTFRRQGTRGKVTRKQVITSPQNPNTTKPNKGSTSYTFTVKTGARTLRAIAQLVLKNADLWREIYDLNQKALNKLDTPLYKMPTKPLPIGMKLNMPVVLAGGSGGGGGGKVA